MFYKLSKCKLCNDNNDKPTVKGLCQHHYWSEKRKTYKKKISVRKPTGELALFKTIFEEREKRCFLTNAKLKSYEYYMSIGMFHNIFHHVLSKGLYGRFRFNPNNIIMLLPDVHNDVEVMATSDLMRKYPHYNKLLTLKDKLKKEYEL
jgi:hypothetical protein